MTVNMSDEDFITVYKAIRFFNDMDEDSDINYSLDLLENAQEVLDKYFIQTGPS